MGIRTQLHMKGVETVDHELRPFRRVEAVELKNIVQNELTIINNYKCTKAFYSQIDRS